MRVESFGRAGPGGLAHALVPIAGGAAASLVASLVMVLVRITLQVRSVPERVLDAVLLAIPPDLFEAVLQRFGMDAKHYALGIIVTAMLLILSGCGAWAIQRHWSVRAILGASLLLWLVVMVVLMPLTDAGLFASAVINGTKAAFGAHLTIALAYAAVLVAVQAWTQEASPIAAPRAAPQKLIGQTAQCIEMFLLARPASRRSAMILSAGVVSTLVATFAAARWGPRLNPPSTVVVEPAHVGITSISPLAPSVATPAANLVPAPTSGPLRTPPTTDRAPTVTAASTPVSTPTSQALPTPTIDPLKEFESPSTRSLTRDPGGVTLQAGRRSGQLTELITDIEDFYIVSKNPMQDPLLKPADWRLRVDGDVQQSIEIDYQSLRNLPQVEIVKTLECISNFVTKCELAPFGCDLISTARWKGARLKDVLSLAGHLKPGVTSLVSISADDYTTTLPIEVAMSPDTLVAYEMNGRPLSREQGYPARILVPGRYGFKNAKWVIALRPLQQEPDDWYAQRSWSKDALVKTMTRIDVPARGSRLPPGHQRIAGIAYAGDRGIKKVEFSADGGERWSVADFVEPPVGRDVWVRWEGSFTLPLGATLTLMARATDGDGELQSEPFALPQPDGSSGWHSLDVHAQID